MIPKQFNKQQTGAAAASRPAEIIFSEGQRGANFWTSTVNIFQADGEILGESNK